MNHYKAASKSNIPASIQLRNTRLRHPLFEEAFNGTLHILKNALATARPNSGVLIHGHGGTGKSTLLDSLTKAIENGTNGAPHGRVLNITFSDSIPTPKSLYSSALKQSNYVLKFDARSTRDGILEDRVVDQIEREKFIAMFIDESQQVIKQSKDELRIRVLDSVKNLSTRTGITTVLSGMRDISPLFDGELGDGQLSTRFATRFYLAEFQTEMALMGFLNGYTQQCTAMDINIIRHKCKEIFTSIGGNLRRLTDFIIMSVEIAENTSECVLAAEHLKLAFKKYYGNAHTHANPF